MPRLPRLPSTWRNKRPALVSVFSGLALLGLLVWVQGTPWGTALFYRQPVLSHLVPLAVLLVGMILVHSRFTNLCARIRRNEMDLEHPPFTVLHGIRAASPFVLLGLLGLAVPTVVEHPPEFKVDWFRISFPFSVMMMVLVWEFAAWNGWWGEPKKAGGKRTKPPVNELADYPITQDGDDLLDRVPLADRLVGEIRNSPSIESVVYGIHGGDGEGKSSLLNLVANRLKQDPSVLPVFFNPWFLRGREALVRNFFTTLDEAVNGEYYLPAFHKKISKYRSILLTGSARPGWDPIHLSPKNDLFTLRKGIEEFLRSFGKKVVILIDELDRLENPDVQTVFSIVKQSAKFRHTIFFLAFDPEKMRKTVPADFLSDFRVMEKIVQNPVTLPPAPREKVLEYLDRQVDLLFADLNVSSIKRERFRDRFGDFWNAMLRHHLTTLRSVKRLIGGLRANLPPIHKEVDLFDFMLVEILRQFFPGAYRDVRDAYRFYIRPTTIEDGLTELAEFGRDDKRKAKEIQRHFREMLEEKGNSPFLREIMVRLFPWLGGPDDPASALPALDDEDRSFMRIRHPGSFHRYFTLTVKDFPLDSEVEGLIHRANTMKADQAIQFVLSKLADAKVSGHLERLLQKIEMFETLLTDDGRKVLSWGIAHNTRQYDRQTPNEWKPTEYEQALKLVHRLVMGVERVQIRHLLISDLIRNSPDTYFVVRLVNSLVQSPEGFDEVDVRRQASARLRRRYLLDKRSLFEDFASDPVRQEIIWAWGTNFGSGDDSNRGDLNLYFLDQMSASPKRIVSFLRLFRTGERFSYDRLERLFHPEKIYRLAVQHRFEIADKPEHAALVEEFLEAYDSRQEPLEPKLEPFE